MLSSFFPIVLPGRIDMTEEYPLPPADNNGEYRWLHSASYVLLKEAVERLKKCSAHADTLSEQRFIIIYYCMLIILFYFMYTRNLF